MVVLAAEPGAELAQEPVVGLAQEPVAPVREAERLAARADPARLPGQAAARAALAAAGLNIASVAAKVLRARAACEIKPRRGR